MYTKFFTLCSRMSSRRAYSLHSGQPSWMEVALLVTLDSSINSFRSRAHCDLLVGSSVKKCAYSLWSPHWQSTSMPTKYSLYRQFEKQQKLNRLNDKVHLLHKATPLRLGEIYILSIQRNKHRKSTKWGSRGICSK